MYKPKLLLISGISPFPQTSGGATRIRQTLIHLSKKYEIYFYFFLDLNQQLTKEEKLFLNQQTASFKAFNLSKKSILLGLKYKIPYHFSNYFSKKLIQEFKNIQSNFSFAQIRIESSQLLYLSKHLLKDQYSKFIALDISTISFYRRSFDVKNPFKIILRLCSCLQVYLYEKSLLKNFSKIVTVSTTDANYIHKLFHLKNTEISPNGIEQICFLPVRDKNKITLGFIGSINHTPNKKALNFLLFKIVPALKKAKIDYDVVILGKDNQKFYKKIKDVKFLDCINDLKDFYSNIDVLIAPIFSGSGTRLKILESLSYAKSVVTTKIGAEGINIQSKFLSIVPNNSKFLPQKWIQEIIYLHNNRELLTNDLAKLEKQLIKFTWKNIFSEE